MYDTVLYFTLADRNTLPPKRTHIDEGGAPVPLFHLNLMNGGEVVPNDGGAQNSTP
jgi:hypothetical protein